MSTIDMSRTVRSSPLALLKKNGFFFHLGEPGRLSRSYKKASPPLANGEVAVRLQNKFLLALLSLFAATQAQVFLALSPKVVPTGVYLLYSISFGNIIGGVSLFLLVWAFRHVWSMGRAAWIILPLHLFTTHVVKATLTYGGKFIYIIQHNPFYWSELLILLGFGVVANYGRLNAEEKLTLIIPFSCIMFLSSLIETMKLLGW